MDQVTTIIRDIGWLADRRSVAVKRLGLPGPTSAELDLMLRAALTAPDHNAIRPWRIVRVLESGRARLAKLFVAAKLKLNPNASEIEIDRDREKALRPPVLLALVSCPQTDNTRVPVPEQIASAGAAMQSILLAAYGLGFGAIILSGSRCADDEVRAAFHVTGSASLLGFISIGTIVDEPKFSKQPELGEVMSDFSALGMDETA